MAEQLRGYLAEKSNSEPLWNRTADGSHRWAQMLRRDLEAAGIAYQRSGPDGPVFADFHSLRHTYLTMLGKNGVDLRTVQELAGHSTPVLTAKYSHRGLDDLAGAVRKLPSFTVGTVGKPEFGSNIDRGTRSTTGPKIGPN